MGNLGCSHRSRPTVQIGENMLSLRAGSAKRILLDMDGESSGEKGMESSFILTDGSLKPFRSRGMSW